LKYILSAKELISIYNSRIKNSLYAISFLVDLRKLAVSAANPPIIAPINAVVIINKVGESFFKISKDTLCANM
jgi:hypothetical protein